jgi:hypothetical protein
MTPMSANILASVIGAMLFAFLQYVWSRYILPQIDKGVAIEGTWITEIEFPDGKENKHRIRLRRFGHAVWGTAICIGGWGRDQGFKYKVTGTFKNMILAAEYEIVGNRRFERGSLALKLVDGGSKLEGYLVYLDNAEDKIKAVACEWLAEGVPSPT